MKNRTAKALLCIALVFSLILAAGCSVSNVEKDPKESKRTAKTTTQTTTQATTPDSSQSEPQDDSYKTVTGAQGFTTKCLDEYTTKWVDEDGLYIYTETFDSIPYVLIFRYENMDVSAEQLLTDTILPRMQNRYGDDLIGADGPENYTIAGQKIPGILFTYLVGDTTVKSLRLCKQIGNDIINFTAKYLDDDDTATMEALETAVRYFELETSAPTTEKPQGDDVRKDLHITKTPGALLAESLTSYTDPNGCFTAKVPAGWAVSCGGKDMYFWIRIYDPNDPCLQVFTLLKAECLLKSQSAKNFYQRYSGYDLYKSSADALVVTSVEDFYRQFMEYCAYTAQYSTFLGFFYDGFNYPQISDFETLEAFANTTVVPVEPVDNKILHGTFTETLSRQKGEGMFSGTLFDALVMPAEGIDVGYNAMYNVNGVTASYGMLGEYLDVLLDILHSVEYTDQFLETVANNQHQSLAAARELNTTLQATSDIITSGWNERQKTYDVTSAKYADSILGYETVYDVETGEVYKAYNGFTDISGIDRYYLPATDEMYSLPIAGYIEK